MLLHQGGPIRPELDAPLGGSPGQVPRIGERLDPHAAASHVRLDEDGEPETLGRRRCQGRLVDDPRPRVTDPQPGEQGQLPRLGDLHREGPVPVEDPGPDALEVGEVLERVEDRLSVAPKPGRGAHPVDEEGERGCLLARVEAMLRRVDPLVVGAPGVELAEQRPEPLGMLVEHTDPGPPAHPGTSPAMTWILSHQ